MPYQTIKELLDSVKCVLPDHAKTSISKRLTTFGNNIKIVLSAARTPAKMRPHIARPGVLLKKSTKKMRKAGIPNITALNQTTKGSVWPKNATQISSPVLPLLFL